MRRIRDKYDRDKKRWEFRYKIYKIVLIGVVIGLIAMAITQAL